MWTHFVIHSVHIDVASVWSLYADDATYFDLQQFEALLMICRLHWVVEVEEVRQMVELS